ncbi:fibronectin type III domain-containing protein [Streptomyces sp. NPDC006512]|uniref:fibronectin type III domain-containing protein n=1 Tax=Streptomyces sp. NPDC006512 TaxID=3154307 RepID=UPI0033A53F87
MRLRRVAAAAVVPIPLLCVWIAPPAAAASTHTITLTGTLFVANAGGIGTSASSKTFNMNREAALSHDRPEATLDMSACVGGESRGHLSVHLQLRPDEMVVVSPTLRLFEGSSCNSDDLDAEDQGIQKGFRPRESMTVSLSAANDEAFSGDLTTTNFTLKHSGGAGTGIGRPAEPSAVVATRVGNPPTSVELQWGNPATDETHLEVRNTTLNQSQAVGADATSFTWQNLPLGKQCFQIRAFNANGASEWTPVNPRSECA